MALLIIAAKTNVFGVIPLLMCFALFRKCLMLEKVLIKTCA